MCFMFQKQADHILWKVENLMRHIKIYKFWSEYVIVILSVRSLFQAIDLFAM